MSFIKGILKPDPIRELETFLEAHPDQISKDDINHAMEAARTGKLAIKGSIDYEGYEDVTVEFKMPSTLKPIQTTKTWGKEM